jgi:hypothetical protein
MCNWNLLFYLSGAHNLPLFYPGFSMYVWLLPWVSHSCPYHYNLMLCLSILRWTCPGLSLTKKRDKNLDRFSVFLSSLTKNLLSASKHLRFEIPWWRIELGVLSPGLWAWCHLFSCLLWMYMGFLSIPSHLFWPLYIYLVLWTSRNICSYLL